MKLIGTRIDFSGRRIINSPLNFFIAMDIKTLNDSDCDGLFTL